MKATLMSDELSQYLFTKIDFKMCEDIYFHYQVKHRSSCNFVISRNVRKDF